MKASDIRNLVLQWVQPLSQGVIDSISGLGAKMKGVMPFGSGDFFSQAFPFGIVSKPSQGVTGFFSNLNGSTHAPVILSHLDTARPTDLNDGETIVYSVGTYKVKVSNTEILIGKGTTYEPVVAGETLRQLLIALIQQLKVEQHMGNLGFQTSYPMNASQYVQLETNNLDNKKILATDDGRFA